MLIIILILFVVLGAIYYATRQPYRVMVPVKQQNKRKYIVSEQINPVGWDLLLPFKPGYPAYPYYRYTPYKRGFFY